MMSLLVGLSLGSCDKELPPLDNPAPTENGIDSTVTDINKAVIDTLSILKSKIETVSADSQQAIGEVENMQISISQQQSKIKWLWVAIVCIGVLILVLFCICVHIYDREKRLRIEIRESKKDLKSRSSTPISRPNALHTDKSEVEKIVKDFLKKELGQNGYNSSTRHESRVEHVKDEVRQVKSGYFENPIPHQKPYFRRLLSSKDSDARFSVEISGDEAQFKPIQEQEYFLTMISDDYFEAAIEFRGCSKNENPSSMDIKRNGKAVRDGEKWVIKEKAIVELKK